MKDHCFRALFIVLIAAFFSPLQAQIITTVAGTDNGGYNGDNIPAVTAFLYQPYCTSFDAAGNMYIADANNHRIRKVDASGTISTIAGTGSAGYSGDGGPATLSSLNTPTGVLVDPVGIIYIADNSNCAIRKITTDGVITTIAGNGTRGYGGDNGPATAAILNGPLGLAFSHTGNLLISDVMNHRIRSIDHSGIITTVVGSGIVGYSGDGGPATSARLLSPSGIATDAVGNLYFGDISANVVRKVDVSGIITTVAGTRSTVYNGDNIQATTANLNYPSALALDGEGNILIADCRNSRIRKVDHLGTITTIAGTGLDGFSGDGGTASLAQLSAPVGVTVTADGDIYIADFYNNRIRRIRNTVGIADIVNGGMLSVFPNPSNGHFTVNVGSRVNEPACITVCDISGTAVATLNTATNKPTDIDILVPGTYILNFKTAALRGSRRIVIK